MTGLGERSSVTPLELEEVLLAPAIAAYSPAAFSPDNQLLAYVVTDNARHDSRLDRDAVLTAGAAWYGLAADIWLSDLRTGESRNLTGSCGHNWAPIWSPDGTLLAFFADRTAGDALGPARIWLWERESDALREFESVDPQGGLFPAEWALSGTGLVVNTIPADIGREGFAAQMKGESVTGQAEDATVKVFEFDPGEEGAAPATDQLNLGLWRLDVVLVDVATGSSRSLIAKQRVLHRAVSPDGKSLVYAELLGADEPGSGRYLSDLRVVDIESGETTQLASSVCFPILGQPFSWSPNSGKIAFRSGAPGFDDLISVVDAAGGVVRCLSSSDRSGDMETFDRTQPVWDEDGETIFFVREQALWRVCANGGDAAAPLARFDGLTPQLIGPRTGRMFAPDGGQTVVLSTMDRATKRVGMSRVDLDAGSVVPIYEEHKRYGGYGTDPAVSPDGTKVAYVAEDAFNPADFYVRERDLSQARPVSQVAQALTGRELGRAEIVEWLGLDGDTLRGALVYPAGFKEGHRYPLIVKVYGGSELSGYLNSFGYANAPIENLQLFATRGYAVLVADSKLRIGSPMADLMRTVMPGVNKVIEMGVADADRIGVTGHSYGGYSAISLVAQSPRFKAVVVRAGFADMIGQYGQLAPDGSNYGLAWAESGQGRMGGSPWEFRGRYLENSPIFLLDRVETPVMIVHGTDDDSVPVHLADQMFTGLRRLGKTVTYLRYEDADHWEGAWSRANQIDVMGRVFDWFDRHLKGDVVTKDH